MDLDTTQLLTFGIGLLAIMNPIGNAAIYIGMVADRTPQQQHKTALTCGIAIAVILLIAVWVGWPILKFFGITIGSFELAGGLIVLLIALSMVRGHPHTHTHNKKDSIDTYKSKESIAVVPMALPIIAGPGAISVVISYGSKHHAPLDLIQQSIVCGIAALILWFVLFFAPKIGRVLGENGMKIVSRVMGLILTAIAAQMMADGIRALLF